MGPIPFERIPFIDVATGSVLLDGWEHMCCGERRKVGDTVTMEVHNYEGTIYEHRHGGGTGVQTRPITGTLTAIHWRRAIMLREGDDAMRLIGYERGMAVDSTTNLSDPADANWAFEFTVETDDQMPPPRGDVCGVQI